MLFKLSFDVDIKIYYYYLNAMVHSGIETVLAKSNSGGYKDKY
jgi:hypothetical protein